MRSFGVPAGLLAPGNKNYSDVTLCCGGTLDFSWMVSAFVRHTSLFAALQVFAAIHELLDFCKYTQHFLALYL